MLLHANGGVLTHVNGYAMDFRGAISCCGGAYGWPLFDESWVDYLKTFNVNFVHARLGPFLTGAGGETDWAATGGGYVETGGKADLSAFNAAFWSRLRALIEYAAGNAMWVEIDVDDGWEIKHCRKGDQPGYSAWAAASNVQGEDACATAGSQALQAGSTGDKWVRQVFETTARYANVIYQDGNEIGLVAGYDPAWTDSIADILREVESAHGWPRHLLGTNSGDATAMQSAKVDYLELHQDTAADPAGCYGRPCLVNEYIPNPPMTAAAFQAQYCDARSSGTYFWYWRHGQSAQQMQDSLTLMESCP